MISRAEIDRLCREHDQWIERAKDEAESAYTQRNVSDAGLVFKTVENALLPRSEPQPEAFYSDDEIDADRERWDALGFFTEAATVAIERLQDENIALKAKLDTVLQLLGASRNLGKKSTDVIDLPNWRRRRDVA
jgi:hypothetical protein